MNDGYFAGCLFGARFLVYAIVVAIAAALLHPLVSVWGFQPSYVGTVVLIVIAAPIAALAVLPFGLWRRVNRARLLGAWRGEHAIHVFLTTGRLAGVFGAALLAEMIQLAHRWPGLQDTWDRSVPFGIVIAVFLGAGVSESMRKLFPAFGVIMAILITLPVTTGGHGPWRQMIAPAVALLASGGLILLIGITIFPHPRTDKDLSGAGFLFGLLCVLFLLGVAIMGLFTGYGAPTGLWSAAFVSAVLAATVFEMLLIENAQG